MSCWICDYFEYIDGTLKAPYFSRCSGAGAHDVCTEAWRAHGEPCALCASGKIYCRDDFRSHALTHLPDPASASSQQRIEIRNRAFPQLSMMEPIEKLKAIAEIRGGTPSPAALAVLNLGLPHSFSSSQLRAMVGSGEARWNDRFHTYELADWGPESFAGQPLLDAVARTSYAELAGVPIHARLRHDVALATIAATTSPELYLGLVDIGKATLYPFAALSEGRGQATVLDRTKQLVLAPDLLTHSYALAQSPAALHVGTIRQLGTEGLSPLVTNEACFASLLDAIRPPHETRRQLTGAPTVSLALHNSIELHASLPGFAVAPTRVAQTYHDALFGSHSGGSGGSGGFGGFGGFGGGFGGI